MDERAKVALVGGRGFLGSRILELLGENGHHVVVLGRDELGDFGFSDPSTRTAAAFVEGLGGERPARLADLMVGVDVIVNAAGSATPDSSDEYLLRNDNVILPLVLHRAAESAGVRRMIHISSASVQGHRDPLDESWETEPLTPYARSKAAAELELRRAGQTSATSVVVYRPASVHGPGRPTTEALTAAVRRWYFPRIGDGQAPLPVTSADSVARAIGHLVGSEALHEGVVAHPWEHVHQRDLLDRLGGARFVRLPERFTRNAIAVAARLSPSAVRAAVRRAEILLLGQRIECRRLVCDGFVVRSADQILDEVCGVDR